MWKTYCLHAYKPRTYTIYLKQPYSLFDDFTVIIYLIFKNKFTIIMIFFRCEFIQLHNILFDIKSLPRYKKLPTENLIYILYEVIYSPFYVHFTFILI